VASEAIASWQRDHGATLPGDLIQLLRSSNGLGLHQEWYDGMLVFTEGAYVFYPFEEIRPAVTARYGLPPAAEPALAAWFALGEGPDATVYFVFDTAARRYLAVAPIVPHEPEDLGPSIAGLLDLVGPAISA
jgi:hypothetical protein